MEIGDIRYILADCDGVLWHGDQPVPGAKDFFAVLKRRGIGLSLISNNPVRPISNYFNMVQKCGGTIDRRQINTSATATTDALLEDFGPGAAFYVISGAGLKDVMRESGLIVYDGEKESPEDVAGVVAANDPAATYLKVTMAMRELLRGKPYYATNADAYYRNDKGLYPGSGWIVLMLEAITGVKPRILGKPERGIFDAAMKRLGADPARTVMIGDHMSADILGGINAGLATMLVYTGITDAADLDKYNYQPDFIFESIAEIAEALNL